MDGICDIFYYYISNWTFRVSMNWEKLINFKSYGVIGYQEKNYNLRISCFLYKHEILEDVSFENATRFLHDFPSTLSLHR